VGSGVQESRIMRHRKNNFACPVRGDGTSGGFSLIEAIVAVAIIAFGVVALVAQLQASYRTTSVNRETNKAMAHLQAGLEKVISTPFSDITTTYPGGSVVSLNNIESSDLLASEQITVTYADAAADPLQVTVTVQWRQFDGRQRTRTLTTLRTR